MLFMTIEASRTWILLLDGGKQFAYTKAEGLIGHEGDLGRYYEKFQDIWQCEI